MIKDYYKILNVPQTATYQQIRNAYKKLCTEYKREENQNPEAQAFFKDVLEAWSVLKDLNKRKIYNSRIQFASRFRRQSRTLRTNPLILTRAKEPDATFEEEMVNRNEMLRQPNTPWQPATNLLQNDDSVESVNLPQIKPSPPTTTMVNKEESMESVPEPPAPITPWQPTAVTLQAQESVDSTNLPSVSPRPVAQDSRKKIKFSLVKFNVFRSNKNKVVSGVNRIAGIKEVDIQEPPTKEKKLKTAKKVLQRLFKKK